jgi:hypothetical protein
MLANEAIAANQKRVIRHMTELHETEYCLVGDGAYAKELLRQLTEQQLTLPKVWLVSSTQVGYPDIEQYIEAQHSVIEQQIIVLGTGHFQLEMIHRLKSKCTKESMFWDLMLCAPKDQPAIPSGSQKNDNYIIYIDMYANINEAAYLSQLFTALRTAGVKVKLHHPLDVLSDQYLSAAESVIVWNGSSSTFLPIMQRLEALNVPLTFAECGFFPQSQYFYFDQLGVNDQSQLKLDNLNWVTAEHINALETIRSLFFAGVTPYPDSGYIFVPLQVPNDSNILNNSSFTSGMQAFIDFIEKKYSSEKIIFKAHPKDRMKSTYSLKHGTFSEDNSRSLILSAKLVHGINSSVLYEAALAKKAVIAEGNCLLTSVTAPIESILAAMVARQHHIDQTFFDEQKLHRFSHFKESLVTALVK